jgi:hypothetical protein
MPTLLIQHSGQRCGVVLTGRVLIGRVAPAAIMLADPSVSRIHAWIDRDGDRFYIADAGSRTGTYVDTFRIVGRHALLDGEEIRVGDGVIAYSDQDELPADVPKRDVAFANDAPLAVSGGILFSCGCGAPLWAPEEWVGRRGKCLLCGERTPIPALPSMPPLSPKVNLKAAAATAAARQCSICQWVIEPTDEQTTCPTCGLTFHAECWQENKGCSAYGCASVDALLDPETKPQPAVAEAAIEEPPERFPIEFAMLGGSVICSLISVLAFGVPSALLAVLTSAYWVIQRRKGESLRNGIVAAAMAMCITGVCAGLWFSAVRWLHRPLAAPWQHVS